MRVRVHDEFGPEALAMMQALYSRSAESVDVHVDRVRERGSSEFMESYYVGYGHASIGDCGVTTLFIENVSILACKAFQNNRLYSGQETSTRYIDFAKQDIVDPLDRPEAHEIQNNWLKFYLDIQAPLVASLKQRFPREADQKEKQWEKAIEARSFDIARGFLPAGITTQFSWTTNLRQAYDNLVLLKAHPLAEVREIANICLSELKTKYPSSFGHREDEAVTAYHEEAARQFSYDRPTNDIPRSDGFGYNCEIRKSDLDARCADLLRKRPAAAGLPKELSAFGSYRCQFDLDYGSFRDLQRHRMMTIDWQQLCPEHGFDLPEAVEAAGVGEPFLEVMDR